MMLHVRISSTFGTSLKWVLKIFHLDSTCNAPPSFRPAKKYSDISGLIANYTDPQSKLHYHNSEEFTTVRNLPSDLTSGYLGLRAATNIVG